MTPLRDDLRAYVKLSMVTSALTYTTSIRMTGFLRWEIEFKLTKIRAGLFAAMQHCVGLNLIHHEVTDGTARNKLPVPI